MSVGLFDHLKQINSKKVPTDKYWAELTDTDKKSWSNYMIHRLLSMNFNFLEICNYVQQFELSSEILYLLYMDAIPKNNIWSPYIKSKKQTKYEDWLIKLLSKYYECSLRESIEYMDILYLTEEGKGELYTIARMYGTDKKLIKKAKL